MIDRVIEQNPDEVKRYQAGETKLLAFFISDLL